jgi:hypothetical protein
MKPKRGFASNFREMYMRKGRTSLAVVSPSLGLIPVALGRNPASVVGELPISQIVFSVGSNHDRSRGE